MRKLPHDIPAVERVADLNLANILASFRTNIQVLFGVKGARNDRAILVSDLLNTKLIGFDDSGNLFTNAVLGATTPEKFSPTGEIAPVVLSQMGSFSGTGKAIGSYYLTLSLPSNCVIVRSWYDVVNSFTGGVGATVAIGIVTDDVAGIVPATGVGSLVAGYYDGIQTGSAANFTVKTTAERLIQVDVAGNSLTAGKLNLFIEYIVSM